MSTLLGRGLIFEAGTLRNKRVKKPFATYAGDDPYLFVSYSHRDRELVYREMTWLYEAGFNLWYDEGIDLGSLWRESLTDSLAKSSACLFFVTQHSATSEHCLRELNFALEEGIKVLPVRLDDTVLPRQLRYSLNDRQALIRSKYDEPTYRQTLTAAITKLTQRGEERILERPDSPAQYRTQIPLLCVNPFSCPTGDDELNFYAKNVASEIGRCMLSASYQVTEGRQSDIALEPEEVGRKHRAQYVLNGTLMRVGDRIRSSVHVAETVHGTQVWAKSIEPTGCALPDMITSLAEKVAADVSFTFYQYEVERIKDVPEEELDAWGLSIRSMSMAVRDAHSANECVRIARLAVERDNGFAESHANLADIIVNSIIAMFSDDVARHSEEVLDHCNKALILNKDSVYVLNRCSRAHRVVGSESLALQLARRVDQLTSGEFTYTLYPALIINGLADEVVQHAENNPRATYSWTSDALVLLEEYSKAEVWIRKSVARTPGSYMGWMRLANVLGHLGRVDEGNDIIEKVKGFGPPDWSIDIYEKSLQLNWRAKASIVGPLISGLKKLGDTHNLTT